jgi:hypothetical protein
MTVKFTNNATGILASSITNAATTVTLTTGQGVLFPTLSSSDYCFVTLVDPSNNFEIVKVTERIADVLTVVRAQDGTTSKAFPAGSRCELRVTSAALNSVVSELTASIAEKAPITSPQFLGNPIAPTPAVGDNTTKIATTAFTKKAVDDAMATLGNMSTQNKDAVDITGGAITGTTVNGIVVGTNAVGTRTVSTLAPTTGGANGDIWFKI